MSEIKMLQEQIACKADESQVNELENKVEELFRAVEMIEKELYTKVNKASLLETLEMAKRVQKR